MKNMKSKLIVSLGILFIYLNANAQSEYNYLTNKYTVASPDVYNFEKFSLNPINYYVGKAVISVPIYTIKTGGIEYSLTLGYDTGGIKVDQLASNVGLGWNLSKAILTRTVNQDNDFDNTGSLRLQSDYNTYSALDKINDFEAAYDYNTEGKLGYFLQKQLNVQHLSDSRKRVDFVPDTYHFYANGFSTSFFFNDENTPVEINPTGAKIVAIKSKQRFDKKVRGAYKDSAHQWQYGTGYNLLSQDFFTIYITTKEGIKYTFSDCDIAFNQVIRDNNSNASEWIEPPAQISAWHITKIEDLNTLKSISFLYEDYYPNPNNAPQLLDESLSQRNFEFVSYPTYPDWTLENTSGLCGYPFSNGNIGGYNLIINARTDVITKYLRKIIFDEGEISFKYSGDGDPLYNQSGGPRLDVYGSEYLKDIILKDKKMKIIKSFHFNYDYFLSNYNVGEFNPDNSYNSFRYKRLKLTSFQELGKPSYIFTYNETVKLPPINSFSVDFLGYYNNSQDALNVATFTIKPKPILYYYPNNFEKSLLPFPISNLQGYVLPGFFNRESNSNIDYVRAWSLNKIQYPIGGSTELIYEQNEFEEFGQNIKGGGLRIEKQILNDGFGVARTLKYSYLKENSVLSSGKLSSYPYFGHPTRKLFDVEIDWQSNPPVITTPIPNLSSSIFHFINFGKSNLNADINSGAYVGYSRVIETEVGNGKKEFLFTSNALTDFQNEILRLHPQYSPFGGASSYTFCSTNYMIANSGMGANIFTDNSYKRGKMLQENVFSESNLPLMKTIINYDDNLINTYSFYQPFTRLRNLVSEENNFWYLLVSKKDFKIAHYLPSTKTVSTYDTSGNHYDITSTLSYNLNGSLNSVHTNTSDGGFVKKLYYYSQDAQMTTEPQINDLIAANIIGVPIKTETFKGLEKLTESKIVYAKDVTTSNLLLPKYVYSKKGTDTNSNLEKKITYNQYDDKGNLLQYTQENGTPVSIIWGYNNTEVVAKIENIELANIPTALITAIQTVSDSYSSTESQVLDALNDLSTSTDVNLQRAMITTYTYISLVGVSTITDPNGVTITYEYDEFNRLKSVKDKNGNILSENEYHYKP
jgi:YD repeat-containing protein